MCNILIEDEVKQKRNDADLERVISDSSRFRKGKLEGIKPKITEKERSGESDVTHQLYLETVVMADLIRGGQNVVTNKSN